MKNSQTNSLNKKNSKIQIINLLKSSIKKKLSIKFQTDSSKFNIKLINDIIYNEKANIVGKFKDYLIYDDTSEFLKRYYKLKETASRLPKIFDFYSSYSKIFPNYISISMAKYIYKNIQKKQKMIDKMQKNEQNEDSYEIDKRDKIFNTNLYNSLMNLTIYSYHKNSMLNSTNKNLINGDCSTESLEDIIDNINNAEEFTQRILLKSKNIQHQKMNEINNSIKFELNQNYSKLDILPYSIKHQGEEKKAESIVPSNVSSHKATLSVPKLPIDSINNNIYNNFKIFNNFQVEFSPKTNSCRLENKNYKSSNVSKRVSTYRKEEQKSSSQMIYKMAPTKNKLQEEIVKAKAAIQFSSTNKMIVSSNVHKTLKNTYSTKNLLITSSTNMKNLNLGHNDLITAIPQTARQMVNYFLKSGKK